MSDWVCWCALTMRSLFEGVFMFHFNWLIATRSLIYRVSVVLIFAVTLFACSDSSDNKPEPPMPDFSATDTWLEDFVVTEDMFPGGSMIIVDKAQGAIHKSAFGDQDEESVALIASVSKMPAVTFLMALHEDDAKVEFDI